MRFLSLPLLLLLLAPGAETPTALKLTGDVQGTHDPAMIHAGDTFYVFATGEAPDGGQFAVRCSPDAHVWHMCGHVFDQIPEWVRQRSPGTKELWAPDIAYVRGEFRLYYAYSLFGKNTSGIGLATNRTLDRNSPEYGWHDKGLVLESRREDSYNAIDPNYVEDEQGHGWLSFGSFWDGIKMIRLDEATGLRSGADTRLYSLARRTGSRSLRRPGADAAEAKTYAPDAENVGGKVELPPDSEAIEAPFIVRHGGWFYLFTSWDLCCRGNRSTYHEMVGRSRHVAGPYVDKAGARLDTGGGTPLLVADNHWFGPGGASLLLHAPVDGRPQDLIVFHAYDAASGKPSMQISTVAWGVDGWPTAALEP